MAAGDVKRLVLVGYGRIAPKHLEAFRALGAEFVACCNRSPEGRQKAEQEGGIPRTYESLTEMLRSERPDGIVCCVSMHHVGQVALELIPHGIPVLLEKPPGTSLAEFEQLCSLQRQTGTPVMVALNRRHYSVVRKAIEDAGGPDQVTSVSVEWSEDPKHFLARGFTVEQVAQMVFGNTLHGIDLLTTLAGEVEQPAISGISRGEPLRWQMALQGFSRRGALVTFNSTWDSPGRWRVSFCSENRRYLFAPLETCEVSELGQKETRKIEPDEADVRFKPGFHAQAKIFLESIDAGRVPGEFDLASVAPAMRLAQGLTDACLASESSARPLAPATPTDAVPPVRRPRIVVLGDSMVMARLEPPITWEDTWPSRLSEKLDARGMNAEVINCGGRARTADKLLGHEFEEHIVMKGPDLVILQIGVVDCAPRLFSRRESRLLNHPLVPEWTRQRIISRRSSRRREILTRQGPLRRVYSAPADFTRYLNTFHDKLTKAAPHTKLIVLPVTCNQQAMDEKSPGHAANVALYNDLLRDFAARAGARWLTPQELLGDLEGADYFASDGYHFNAAGCMRCATTLAELIQAEYAR